MFGYIKPFAPELKVKEYEFYKSVYCSLCKSMGKHTTCFSRFTLSYDFVFLALIRMALSQEKCEISQCRCLVHPLKKRTTLNNNPSLKYCSLVSGILMYHNIRDNIYDSKGIKKIISYSALPAAKHIRKKSFELLTLDNIIRDKLIKLNELEKSSTESIDQPASVFGEILSAVCSYGFNDNKNTTRIAEVIGYHLGRWIYIVDAADDFEKDKKSGNYNPFICSYKTEDVFGEHRESLLNALTMELTHIESAINLIDFSDCSGIENIIKNILYLGMTDCAYKIFKGA